MTRSRRREKHRFLFRPQVFRLWALLALFVVLGASWFFVSSHTFQRAFVRWTALPLQIAISSPKYLSANEDEEIEFAIENTDTQTDTLPLTIWLMGDSPFMHFLVPERSNLLYDSHLQRQEQVNRQLNVRFPCCDSNSADTMWGKSAGLSLWWRSNSGSSQKIGDLPISIAPLPRARAVEAGLAVLIVGLITWFCKELWSWWGKGTWWGYKNG